MYFGSARWMSGSFGRGDGDVPEFRQRPATHNSLEAMAHQNGWTLRSDLPTYTDGSPLDISGGPFAPRQWHPLAPVVEGRAGYWRFWAATVSAMTRGAQWRPYAVTFIELDGAIPYVHVYPEAWRASITSVTHEVHLESGDFNDRFATFAKDAQTVYGLLNPRAMQLLLESPPIDEVWTAGQFVCIARVDPHYAEALGAQLGLLTTIAGGIPSSLFERD